MPGNAGGFGIVAGPILGLIMLLMVIFTGGGFAAAWRTCWVVCAFIWAVAIVAIITGHASHG